MKKEYILAINLLYCINNQNAISTALKSLGLVGTKSHTKFVPDIYKYNSVDVRLGVLQGLIDTDGYVNNDNGVITPTAALSSFPYTPKESMAFLKFLYKGKPEFIGSAGPYDATSVNFDNWTTPRYLAIDQGTIAPMIENYRTGLLWKLFMDAPEIQKGLKNLGFHSTEYGF